MIFVIMAIFSAADSMDRWRLVVVNVVQVQGSVWLSQIRLFVLFNFFKFKNRSSQVPGTVQYYRTWYLSLWDC